MSDAEFLDSVQYTDQGLEAYQVIFGKDFVSPGGEDSARRFITQLELSPGALVLDVCSGLGGSAFLMAQEFGLTVEGVDLSTNMLSKARKRCRELGLEHSVSFSEGNCLELDRPQRYDAVYSRDAFMHIADKSRLAQVLARSLKPGGRLLFTDYCAGPPPWTPEFQAYVAQRGYHMETIEGYIEVLESAGLRDVRGENLQSLFVEIFENDLAHLETQELEACVKSNLRDSWQAKLERARRGEHRWGLFRARKG